MTSDVMDFSQSPWQHAGMKPTFSIATPVATASDPSPRHAGLMLRDLRLRSNVSQLDLSLRVGVSQRHLSCIETGKACASREMLFALLEGLNASLSQQNETLLAAGFAPVFGNRPMEHHDMRAINEVIDLMLMAQRETPALVLDSAWNLVKFNPAFVRLLELLEFDPTALQASPNILLAMAAPGGLASRLINRSEVLGEVLCRARREASHVPALQAIVDQVPQDVLDECKPPQTFESPTLLTRFSSSAGTLSFMSTFTSFGAPLDVTVASLRIEHLFPVDALTRGAFSLEPMKGA